MKSNASTFRAYARIEESMIRAAMPRTSERDPQQPNTMRAARTWTAGRLVAAIMPLTFTLSEAEVTRG